jgi:hypothetical protein
MFWMSFEDLVKHFYSVNVCMVRLLPLFLSVASWSLVLLAGIQQLP